jgi:glutathione peroxidase-family protein
MGKVNVNGPDASLVYKYLKQQTGVASITWNFATYFVVSPEGVITAHSGVEPMELKGSVLTLLSKEEL